MSRATTSRHRRNYLCKVHHVIKDNAPQKSAQLAHRKVSPMATHYAHLLDLQHRQQRRSKPSAHRKVKRLSQGMSQAFPRVQVKMFLRHHRNQLKVNEYGKRGEKEINKSRRSSSPTLANRLLCTINLHISRTTPIARYVEILRFTGHSAVLLPNCHRTHYHTHLRLQTL